MRNREEEAGYLYEKAARAVHSGGDDLRTISVHLRLMIRGTVDYQGPLWPLRILSADKREVRLDRFIDYLRKPVREGLGLPSLHFLREVLLALPEGIETLGLVRAELAKEGVDFDAEADREERQALDESDRAQQRPHGGDRVSEESKIDNVQLAPTPTGNSSKAALRRLRKDRPDLHQDVIAGKITPHAAMVNAGFRPKTVQIPLDPALAAKALRRHFSAADIETIRGLLL